MPSSFDSDYQAQSGDGHESDVIRSAANPLVKRIRSLQRRKTRYMERAFVVEGFRAVEDVLSSGAKPEVIVLREDMDDEAVLMQINEERHSWRRVDARLFETLTDQPHAQGIIAVVPMIDQPVVLIPETGRPMLLLLLDGIRDPGNLGTLFRSAAGAGVDHVYLTPETVDPYNPRVVRAAMGAHFRIRFSSIALAEISDMVSSAHTIGRAEADGVIEYDDADWTQSSIIVIGGEANGVSDLVRELTPMTVRIPLTSNVESLNAAVAGSLLVFEAARQRRKVK